MSSLDRLPPASEESEAAFLGSCLINSDGVDAGLDLNLKGDDFYKQDYGMVWRAMQSLAERGKAIDIVTVSEWLRKSNTGVTASFVTGLMSASPTSMNAVHYAQIIKDKSMRRSLITAASKISGFAFDESDDIDTMLDKADNALRTAKEKAPLSGNDPDPGDILDRMEGAKASGPKTRLPALNAITSGMTPGHIWVVGGFSSTGKSAFGVNLVEDVVLAGGSVMIASTEMTQEQYMLRLMSLTSGVPQRKIRYGGMNMEEMGAYQQSREFWKPAKIRIYDDLYNLTRIRRVAQRVRRELGGLDMLMVDFIQNINETGDEVKDARIAAIKLQALAKELDTCVIAMSQISNAQAIQQNEKGMGNYYAFKGSGAIKDAADLAIMLDRDRKNAPEVLWVYVVKNRHDSLATIGTKFDLPTGSVQQMTDEEQFDADPNSGRRSRRNVDDDA